MATSPTQIKLTGVGISMHPAERAILELKAESHRVDTPGEASQQVTKAAVQIRELITPHCPTENGGGDSTQQAPAISHYSMTKLDTRVHEAYGDNDVVQYSARAEFHVKFASFGILNTLATQLSRMENVIVVGITWELMDVTVNSLYSGTRKRAAADAIRRARDYAEAFCDLTPEEAVARVKPFYISENYNNYSRNTRPKLHYGKTQRGSVVSSEELQFEPEDISLECKVEAHFQVEKP